MSLTVSLAALATSHGGRDHIQLENIQLNYLVGS
ncbi:hypothetical protein ACVI1J_010447 [Bradyrhizobium diazoefficiens]